MYDPIYLNRIGNLSLNVVNFVVERFSALIFLKNRCFKLVKGMFSLSVRFGLSFYSNEAIDFVFLF